MAAIRLYDLLPGLYRHRDLFEDGALKALLDVLQHQYNLLEEDITALYDNWFIETCDAWVVPYLGELLGLDLLNAEYDQRARVANTLNYRSAKGTTTALKGAIQDGTGWTTHVAPFYPYLSRTQTVSVPNLTEGRTVNLKSADILKLNTPFDPAAYTVNIASRRRYRPTPAAEQKGLAQDTPSVEAVKEGAANISHMAGELLGSLAGKYSLEGVGVYLWRLQRYPATKVMAYQVKEKDDKRYFLHPMGVETLLYNLPARSYELLDLSAPLHKSSLRQVIKALPAAGQAQLYAKLRGESPFAQVWLDETEQSIEFADLSDSLVQPGEWNLPQKTNTTNALAIVDPLRGRLYLPQGAKKQTVRASFVYGFSQAIGGGAYERVTLPLGVHRLDNLSLWRAYVGTKLEEKSTAQVDNTYQFTTLDEAISAWQEAKLHGVIQIVDSDSYDLGKGLSVSFIDGYSLVIEAAPGTCPVLRGPLQFIGSAQGSLAVLSGIWLDEALTLSGKLSVYIEHCTINPPRPYKETKSPVALISQTESARATPESLTVLVHKSILGPVMLPETAQLQIEDSLIDGQGQQAISGPPLTKTSQAEKTVAMGPITFLERVTIWGEVTIAELVYASNVIFNNQVQVHREEGVVRYSYVPAGAKTPPRYRCQTEWEGVPQFTATTYGHPAYGQLAQNITRAIAAGASDQAELGVFHNLYQPQRQATLNTILDELIPAHLKPVVIFVE
jgi:hypothetical protein